MTERFEIQIRTFEMHKIAEEGVAAHWKYKEKKSKAKTKSIIRRLRKIEMSAENTENFVRQVTGEVLKLAFIVFTPERRQSCRAYKTGLRC